MDYLYHILDLVPFLSGATGAQRHTSGNQDEAEAASEGVEARVKKLRVLDM